MLAKSRLCGYHTDMILGPGCVEVKVLSNLHSTNLVSRHLGAEAHINWCQGIRILSFLNRVVHDMHHTVAFEIALILLI